MRLQDNYTDEEIFEMFSRMTYNEREEIFSYLTKDKVLKIKKILFTYGECGWGDEMDKMLRQGHPKYMNSSHSQNEKYNCYEEKGNKRKIFIIKEEEF